MIFEVSSNYLNHFETYFSVSANPERKKRVLIFSNVKYPPGHKISTRSTDILVFINSAQTAAYYKNDEVKKIFCWHRTMHPDFGQVIQFAENHYVYEPQEIPQDFIDGLEKTYDWNYEPRPGRRKCLTTGYIVVKWIEKNYPDREICLINFGMEVQGSTRRSTDHNWEYEDLQMQIFRHIYTADAKKFRKRKIFLLPDMWLGDMIVFSAVIRNIIDTGLFDVNIDFRGKKEIWTNCPYLNPEITPKNADNVFRLRNGDRWRADCRHLIAGLTAQFAGYIGEKIPCNHTKPEIYMNVPAGRMIENKYVLVNTGWQCSAPTKKWSQTYWQQLIDAAPDISFVQVGKRKDHAVPLNGSIDMIDKTNIPQLAQLVRDADCVISPPSGVVHIAAAFSVKSIVLAGGREPAHLTAYPDDCVLSRIGDLSCCRRGGCRNNFFWGEKRICNRGQTVGSDDYPTAQCMAEITPEMVLNELRKIWKDNEK